MDVPNHSPTLQPIVERIRSAGLVTMLPADQRVDRLLEVGDALLASPILAVAIPMDHPEATALLVAYRKRYGDHLLVGAGAIASLEAGLSALAHGADFLLTTRYETALHNAATRCGALYIPPAAAPAAVTALAAMAVLMVSIQSSVLGDGLPAPHSVDPTLLAIAETCADAVADCARAGAAAVLIEQLVAPATDWQMPTMIRTARQLRRAWFDAVQE